MLNAIIVREILYNYAVTTTDQQPSTTTDQPPSTTEPAVMTDPTNDTDPDVPTTELPKPGNNNNGKACNAFQACIIGSTYNMT